MFERFSGEARQAIVQAQEEARQRGHGHIESEHVLLGALTGTSTVVQVLVGMRVAITELRADIGARMPSGGTAPSGHIPFSPRAKKVLELSLREALGLGHNGIGTGHVLLGVLREGSGPAGEVLAIRGVTLERARDAVRAEAERTGGAVGRADLVPLRTPAAEQAVAAAGDLAGGGPVGSQHLLEALARADDSAAARVLASLGIDPDQLAQRIDELGTGGTTDDSPEAVGLRDMEVRLDGDEVHVVLRDASTVDLAQALTTRLGGPLRGSDPVHAGLAGMWRAIRDGLEGQLRLLDPEPLGEAAAGGTGSVVQRAVRSRLRFRQGPPPGDFH